MPRRRPGGQQGLASSPPRGFGPEDQLRTAEERDLAPSCPIVDHGIPDLCRVAQMDRGRDAGEHALAEGTQEVALELDRREILGARRQMREAAVTARGAGQRNDSGRVKVTL